MITASCVTDPALDPSTEQERQALVESVEYGVYKNSEALFAFDVNDHQFYSADGKISRIVANDASAYVEFEFAYAPVVNKFIEAKTTVSGIFLDGISSGTYKYYILKKEGSKCWVWCDDEKFGALLWIY